MELFWILITLVPMTFGRTLGQTVEWDFKELENDPSMDSLVEYFYRNNNNSANFNLTQLQDTIHEKLASLNLSDSKFDKAFNFDSAFDFNNVAITPLGQLTAWVGDIVYPFIIYGIIFGGAFIILQFIIQIVGFVGNYKLTMLGLITEMVTNVQNILTDQLTRELAESSGDSRIGRAVELIELAAQVYDAIEAYSN